jgi:superfamily II DNA or RNA helicase
LKKATIKVLDQVNVKWEGLDPHVRHKLTNAVKFMIPNARYTPQYKLGRWDGTISFCSAAGSTYLNLLDRLIPIVIDDGYEIEIDDRRPLHEFQFPEVTDELFADKVWPMGHEMAGEPIMLRDYQVDAITTYLSNLQSVQEIGTGAGKTLMTAALSLLVEPYGRSVIIVPSKSLIMQTEEDYRNLDLDVGVYFGDRKEWNHKHTIATWQSLSVFSKKTRLVEVDVPIEDFLRDVICVMNDEAHSAKAKELKDLLTGPFSRIPIRWGLTGTLPKEEHEAICLLAAIGPKVGEIRSSDLQEKGVLADCQVQITQLIDDHVEFSDYDTEHKFLLTDPDRIRYIAGIIQEITETGNTLVLVDRIEAGETLQKLIPESVFICGDVKAKNRAIEYKSVQEANDKLIIATYGVASVGINLPRLFNLVLIEPGKSFVRVIQSIGRGLRRANDKDRIRIVDLCSSLKFSKRHLTKRKQFYGDARYPYGVKQVKYV